MLQPPLGGPGSWQSPFVPEAHGIVQQLSSVSAEAGSHPGGTAAGVASCSGQSRSAGEASTADTAKWKAHTHKCIEEAAGHVPPEDQRGKDLTYSGRRLLRHLVLISLNKRRRCDAVGGFW